MTRRPAVMLVLAAVATVVGCPLRVHETSAQPSIAAQYRAAANAYRQAANQTSGSQRVCYLEHARYQDCLAAQLGPNAPGGCGGVPTCSTAPSAASGSGSRRGVYPGVASGNSPAAAFNQLGNVVGNLLQQHFDNERRQREAEEEAEEQRERAEELAEEARQRALAAEELRVAGVRQQEAEELARQRAEERARMQEALQRDLAPRVSDAIDDAFRRAAGAPDTTQQDPVTRLPDLVPSSGDDVTESPIPEQPLWQSAWDKLRDDSDGLLARVRDVLAGEENRAIGGPLEDVLPQTDEQDVRTWGQMLRDRVSDSLIGRAARSVLDLVDSAKEKIAEASDKATGCGVTATSGISAVDSADAQLNRAACVTTLVRRTHPFTGVRALVGLYRYGSGVVDAGMKVLDAGSQAAGR